MTEPILVAGIGNIFLSDDGFGVEVIKELLLREIPVGVEVVDIGIRGVHLGYQLMDGYKTLILVDAVPRDFEPGTVFILEPDTESASRDTAAAVGSGAIPLVDSHGMEPGSMLAMLDMLGGKVGRIVVVGCQPSDVSEGMGLTPPVAAAVPRAVEMVLEVIADETELLASNKKGTVK